MSASRVPRARPELLSTGSRTSPKLAPGSPRSSTAPAPDLPRARPELAPLERPTSPDEAPVDTPRARPDIPREDPPEMLMSIAGAYARIEALEEENEKIASRQIAILKALDDVLEKIGGLTTEVAMLHRAVDIVGESVAPLLPRTRSGAPGRTTSPVPGRLTLNSEEDFDRTLSNVEKRRLGIRVASWGDTVTKAVLGALAVALAMFVIEEVRHMHDGPVNQAPVTIPTVDRK
jgi:hypothetical protein